MRMIEVAGDPATTGLVVDRPSFLAGRAAERTHPALVEVRHDLQLEAAGPGDRPGRLDRASHPRGIEGTGGERSQVTCHGLGLPEAPFPQADVRLGAVETVGGRGLGVAE